MKQLKFYIKEFIYAYKNDPAFRELLKSIYKCTLFVLIGLSALVFFAWFIVTVGNYYKQIYYETKKKAIKESLKNVNDLFNLKNN